MGIKNMSPTDTVAFESSEPLKVTPVESVVSRQQICMWSVARAQVMTQQKTLSPAHQVPRNSQRLVLSWLFPPASAAKCFVQSAVRALGVLGSESGGPVAVITTTALRPKLAHFFLRHGSMVNVSGFESHTVSVPAIHFATVVWL